MKSLIYVIMIAFIICGNQGFTQTIWTQNGTAIYTSSANNAGIGTATPDKELTVNGKIHAKEIKVSLSVPAPDYVFGKDYKLIQLDELERYLVKNKHLPEVSSAGEMEQSGIKVSEMSMLLLKKTEELTLYIINHEERLNALQRRTQIINNN